MRARLPEERATIERSRVMTAAIREELKKKLADDTREQINQNAGRYDTILAYALSDASDSGGKESLISSKRSSTATSIQKTGTAKSTRTQPTP